MFIIGSIVLVVLGMLTILVYGYLAYLFIRLWWYSGRFSNLVPTIVSIDGGVVSEVEYRDVNGMVVGYWAYGHFDPNYPYRPDIDGN